MSIIAFLALFSSTALLHAQANSAASQDARSSTDTSFVTCGDKPRASKTVRSDVLVSADGKRRAYVEVEARAIAAAKPGSGPPCVNNSRLLVAGDSVDYRIVFLQEASDAETGNSLRVVDWSADGRRLLLELALWPEEGLGVTRSPLIYDATNGIFRQPDMLNIFRKHFGIECSLEVRVAGFAPDGKVVIDTQPLGPEDEEVLALPTCAKKKASWAVSIMNETIEPFADSTKLERHAKSEPTPAK